MAQAIFYIDRLPPKRLKIVRLEELGIWHYGHFKDINVC